MADFMPQPFKGMPLSFDYKYLEDDDVLYVKRKTKEIRSLNRGKGTRVYGRDVFAIGAILLDVRSKIPTQELFDAWREQEAQITESIAWTYTRVTRAFEHAASKLGNVPCTVLYELTLPSYPQPFLERILSGLYVPSLEEVRRMREHKRASASADQANESPARSHNDVIQNISDQITLAIQQQLHALPLTEKEGEIADLQGKVQSLTENYNTTIRELEIANESLIEKDKEITEKDTKIEKLEEDNAKLSKEKGYLLDKCRVDSDKLNRLIMTMKQICGEN